MRGEFINFGEIGGKAICIIGLGGWTPLNQTNEDQYRLVLVLIQSHLNFIHSNFI